MDRKLNSRYKMAVVHFPNESAVMMKTQSYFRKVTPLMLICLFTVSKDKVTEVVTLEHVTVTVSIMTYLYREI